MDKLDLQRIADELKQGISEKEAYFGIFEHDDAASDMYIKANENGLSKVFCFSDYRGANRL